MPVLMLRQRLNIQIKTSKNMSRQNLNFIKEQKKNTHVLLHEKYFTTNNYLQLIYPNFHPFIHVLLQLISTKKTLCKQAGYDINVQLVNVDKKKI